MDRDEAIVLLRDMSLPEYGCVMNEHKAAKAGADALVRLHSIEQELAEARRDGAQLTYIIDESNNGNGWLDDEVWEAAAKLCPINTKEAEDVQKWVRRTIDAAMQAQKGGEG